MPDIKQAPTLLAGEIYPPTFSPSSAMSVLSTSFAPLLKFYSTGIINTDSVFVFCTAGHLAQLLPLISSPISIN